MGEGSSYAEIFKLMKRDPELKKLGESVTKIRKNTAGNLLLKLDRKVYEKINKLRELAGSSSKEKCKSLARWTQ